MTRSCLQKKVPEKPAGLKRPPMFLKGYKKTTPALAQTPQKSRPNLVDPDPPPNAKKAAAINQALPSFIAVSNQPQQQGPSAIVAQEAQQPANFTAAPPPPPPPPLPPANPTTPVGPAAQAQATPKTAAQAKPAQKGNAPPPSAGIDLKAILNARKTLKPMKQEPKVQDEHTDFLKHALNRFQRCLDPNIAEREAGNPGEGSSESDFDSDDD